MKHNLEHELDRHESTIRQVLGSDIIAAYYYQSGTVEYGLRFDKQMKEACRLLKTPTEYRKILGN